MGLCSSRIFGGKLNAPMLVNIQLQVFLILKSFVPVVRNLMMTFNHRQMCEHTMFWREQLFTKTSGGEVCQMRCTECGLTYTIIETGGNITGIKYP